MPFIILSADDPALYSLSQQMSIHYKDDFAHLTPDLFKDSKLDKMRVTFSGHAGTRCYGEENLSPAAFYNKLKALKFPFNKVNQIDLHGCEIGLRKDGETTYLTEFARCMYADPENRHITIKGFTDLALPEESKLGTMFVRANHISSQITGIKTENLNAYYEDKATVKNITHEQSAYFVTEHEELLLDHKMGIREALDSNENYSLTFDIFNKQQTFSQYRLQCWANINNRITHINQTMPPSDIKTQMLFALGEAKKNVEDIKQNLSTITERLIDEKIPPPLFIDPQKQKLTAMHNFLKNNQEIIDQLKDDKKTDNTSLLLDVTSETPLTIINRLFSTHSSHPDKMKMAESIYQNIRRYHGIDKLNEDLSTHLDNTDVTHLLLNQGADPHILEKDFFTPFERAIQNEYWQAISLMLLKTPDLTKINRFSREELLVAREKITKALSAYESKQPSTSPATQLSQSLANVFNELAKLKTQKDKKVVVFDTTKAASPEKKDVKSKRNIEPSKKIELLHLAIKANLDEKIKMLFDEKSLEAYVLRGDEKAVSLLLKAGAHPNIPPTLLYDAFYLHPNSPIIDLLLNHKANPNSQREKNTVLESMVLKGDEKSVAKLLKFGASTNTPLTLLYDAYNLHPNSTIIDLLLTHKADPNSQREKYTVLKNTVMKGDEKSVSKLLNAGADPNSPSDLLYDAINNYPGSPIIKLLLDSKANLNTTKDGHNLLEIAGIKHDEKSTSFLLQAGANPNIPPSLLHDYITFGNAPPHVINLLLDKKADPNSSRNGMTALAVSAYRGDEKMVDLLIHAGAIPSPTHFYDFAHIKPESPILNLLLDKTTDPDVQKNGYPLLHFAVGTQKPPLIDALLNHGANPLLLSSYHKTSALSESLQQASPNFSSITKMLLKIPANDLPRILEADRKKIIENKPELIKAYNTIYPDAKHTSAMFKSPQRIVEVLEKLEKLQLTTENRPMPGKAV